MNRFEKLKNILISVLGLGSKGYDFNNNTPLIGHIQEFDSLTIVTVIETIEDQFDIVIDDEEVDAEVFETFGSLLAFVERKVD